MHRDSPHGVDRPSAGGILPLSPSVLLLAPGGWESSKEPQALMAPDRSKILFLRYLATEGRGEQQCARSEPLGWRKGCQALN